MNVLIMTMAFEISWSKPTILLRYGCHLEEHMKLVSFMKAMIHDGLLCIPLYAITSCL